MSEWEEQTVTCPITGEEHSEVGPEASMCPTRDVVRQWLQEEDEEASVSTDEFTIIGGSGGEWVSSNRVEMLTDWQ